MNKLREFKAFADKHDIPVTIVSRGIKNFLEITEQHYENYKITVELFFLDIYLSEIRIKESKHLTDSRTRIDFYQKLRTDSSQKFTFEQKYTLKYKEINQDNKLRDEDIFLEIGTVVWEFLLLANLVREEHEKDKNQPDTFVPEIKINNKSTNKPSMHCQNNSSDDYVAIGGSSSFEDLN